MNLLWALIFGIGFGYILQRVGAFEYQNIVNALRLKDLTIPKFMLLSVAITSVGLFSLYSGGLVVLDMIVTNPVANIVGGLIFGAGFALAGYCPGTSIGAMAEGKRDARYTVVGGLFGVLTYTLLQQYAGLSFAAYDAGKINLADLIPLNPFSLAVIYSAAIISIIYLVDAWEQKKDARTPKNITTKNISAGTVLNHAQE
ncbi:sulfur transport [Neomoorella glycerini]|uniref:Sulfur transport n=1 Tax=Neomoorella glycerini TaxID=55779 RepID=A0A6I5ZN44_9FIRM|nr:YeeE/YedE thiosulfate transporter family protein [Moorella glycerini]QGP91312.1 sulfur transport [Moorella glycerini]